MLEKLVIKQNAIKYIKRELGFAEAFGRAVADNLDLDQGCVFVYLPRVLLTYTEEFQNSILGAFQEIDYGGIQKELVISEIKTKPKKFVFQYLQENTVGCAIFETFYRYSPENKKHIESKPYIILNNDVFWFMTQENANLETVNQCFKARKEYPSIVGLSTLPVSWKLNNFGEEVQNETIQLLIEGLDYLLVGSYDEETFLIWERCNVI